MLVISDFLHEIHRPKGTKMIESVENPFYENICLGIFDSWALRYGPKNYWPWDFSIIQNLISLEPRDEYRGAAIFFVNIPNLAHICPYQPTLSLDD